jgi:hypothetical protein
MKNSKYKGKKININPNRYNTEIIFMTSEKFQVFQIPIFLIVFENKMYFAKCNYRMHLLEIFTDWEHNDGTSFNPFQPGQKEFDFLTKLNPTYYSFDYNETIKGNLDEFSIYEADIIKRFNRQCLLVDILNKKDT